jgi:hypothetical protein
VTYSPHKEEITQFAAWTISKGFIKPYLKAPSTAEFPREGLKCYSKGDTYTVVAYVDAQNSFGAMLRQIYTCQMMYKGGGWTDPANWNLIEATLNGEAL